jgi:hypothetical protein
MSEVDWAKFFREYAAANQAHDAVRVAAFFQFNEQVGVESLDVAGVRASAIDERHVLVAVDWVMRFSNTEAGPVPFRICYIVSLVDSGRPKLIGYIAQEDQKDLMKRRGLIKQ